MRPWPDNADPAPIAGLPYNVESLLAEGRREYDAARFGLYRNSILNAAQTEIKHGRYASAVDHLLAVAYLDACGAGAMGINRRDADVYDGVARLALKCMDNLGVGKRMVRERFLFIAASRQWLPHGQVDPEKAWRTFGRAL